MKRFGLFTALLLCSSVLTIRAEDKACFPSRYEGQRYNLLTGATSFFAVDHVARRYLLSNKPVGQSFQIFDYAHDYLHTFRDGNCTTAHYLIDGMFDQCIHDDANLPNLSLGEVGHSLDVRVIGYRTCNISRTTMTTEREGLVLPFIEHDRHDDGRIDTTFFLRLSPSISCFSNNIYSDVSGCTHLNWDSGIKINLNPVNP